MRITHCTLVLLLTSFCSALFGQTEAEIDSIYRVLNLDDVVVTAQYAPTSSKNAVHQVRVIQAADIQRQGQVNLAEVLTNQLNLRVSTDPILGNGLQIQGIGGENVQILIDGVPVIGRVNGNIDLSQINLQNVDRIEIVEGAMSAQYGSNASGGVVNIITKKSQVKGWEVKSQNQYEDIGIWQNALSLGLQSNRWYVGLSGARNESRFIETDSLRVFQDIEFPNGETISSKKYPWNPKTQYNLDGTLRYRQGDTLSVVYQYRQFWETLESYGEIRRPQFQPYAQDEFYTTLRRDHSLTVDSYLGDKFYLQSTTGYNYFEREKEALRLDIEADTTSLVEGKQDTTTFNTFLHRSSLSSVSRGKLNGQIGLEVLHEVGTGQRIIDSTTTPLNETQMTNYAAWLSLRYALNPVLSVQANLRYGYNTKYDHPLIPAVHVKWEPLDKLSMQLSYARGFRAPSLKELHFNFIDINHFIIGNTDLRAEHSENASLNINYEEQWGGNRMVFSGKLFYNLIEDRIVLTEFGTLQYNYQNLERFETNGLNVGVQYHWKDNLTVKSGGSLTRLYNVWTEDYSADRFTKLYEFQSELSFEIPYIDTRLFVTSRYIGKQVQFYLNEER